MSLFNLGAVMPDRYYKAVQPLLDVWKTTQRSAAKWRQSTMQKKDGVEALPRTCTKDGRPPVYVKGQKEAKILKTSAAGLSPTRTRALLSPKFPQKNGSFSLIERVILSAGAMLIFSVSFQIDQMPEGERKSNFAVHILMIVCCEAEMLLSRKAASGT
jgi:hypothetical protein